MKATRRALEEIARRFSRHLLPGEDFKGELELDELLVELHVRVRRRASAAEQGRWCEEALAVLDSAPFHAERCSATTRARSWPGAPHRQCSRPVAVAIAVESSAGHVDQPRFYFLCRTHRDAFSGRVLGVVTLPARRLRDARERAERERAEYARRERAAEQGARAIAAWLGSYREVDELAERRARRGR